jgi:tRNA G37 N-methylase Trm5
MNLPESADKFIDVACQAIKSSGGIAHFYAFVRQPDTIEKLEARFTEAVNLAGRKVDCFVGSRNIRETAPFESQVVLDAKIV